MSSSTALLPKDNNSSNSNKRDDHPIFLRVCHSPWVSISQNSLVGLRGLSAFSLLVSSLMILDYELKHNDHGWLVLFNFANITYGTETLYHWLAFTWTFMHLHYPHHGSQPPSHATRFQKMLSPPRQNAATQNKYFFSVFYYAATTFPLLVSFIHWGFLIPQGKTTIPADQIFNHGWFRVFYVFNKFGFNSFIALVETLFFSSVRRPNPIWSHVTGFTVLLGSYIGWAFVGYVVTDKFSYYFLDHKQVSWEHVVGYAAGFIALGQTFLGVSYGVTALRERFTRKGEDKSYGYTRLPQ